MRIAMIGQKGVPALHGGIERHVHELSLRLVARGFAVRVYGRKWYTRQENGVLDGIEQIHVPSVHSKHLDTITYTFFATLHAMWKKVDVIHYHGVGPSLLAFLPRIFTPKIAVVSTFHSIDRKHQKWGFWARFFLRLGEWATCRFPHRTVVVSRTIRQYVRDVYDTQSVYIPNAVPLYKKTQQTDLLSAWGLKPKSYVLAVSRLIPHKGIHYLIDAWKAALESSPESFKDTKLVIVGDGYYTDAYVQDLRARAEGNKSIVFTGFQSGSTLHTLYEQALYMVHPSDNEGLPIAVLEAMSHGLPVLVSDIPEHQDLVKTPEFLFARGLVSDLSQKLMFLMSHPKQLQAEGERNRLLIEKEFEWESAVDDIASLYEEVSSYKVLTRPTLEGAQ